MVQIAIANLVSPTWNTFSKEEWIKFEDEYHVYKAKYLSACTTNAQRLLVAKMTACLSRPLAETLLLRLHDDFPDLDTLYATENYEFKRIIETPWLEKNNDNFVKNFKLFPC